VPEIPDQPEDQERDEKITDSGESIPVSLAAVGAWLAERYAEAQVAMGPKLIAAADETQLAINRINGEALMRAYRAGREDAARDRDDQIRRAARRLVARIIANAHLLDVPFSDAPDRSPWTELKRDMNALYEVVGIRLGFAPWGDQPRTLLQGEVQDNPEAQQCPARFSCESCRCVLDAGHDGDHDQHCQGRPTQ
jgi:hypothetical protein